MSPAVTYLNLIKYCINKSWKAQGILTSSQQSQSFTKNKTRTFVTGTGNRAICYNVGMLAHLLEMGYREASNQQQRKLQLMILSDWLLTNLLPTKPNQTKQNKMIAKDICSFCKIAATFPNNFISQVLRKICK